MLSGLMLDSTKIMKKASKLIVHVLPGVKFSLSLCNANQREDLAVQQKSVGRYPKYPSNLLILLETLPINFVRNN